MPRFLKSKLFVAFSCFKIFKADADKAKNLNGPLNSMDVITTFIFHAFNSKNKLFIWDFINDKSKSSQTKKPSISRGLSTIILFTLEH